jgi:hypothetical protein
MRRRSVPAVPKPRVSAAGRKMPVLLSSLKAKVGNPALDTDARSLAPVSPVFDCRTFVDVENSAMLNSVAVTVPVTSMPVAVFTTMLPASSGNVSVLLVLVAGLLIVNTPVPVAEGVSAIFAHSAPYGLVGQTTSSSEVAVAVTSRNA